MLHQHGGGDSADTAGNGGDGLDDGLDFLEDGVAGHAALALGGDLLGVPVHGNVDDDLALADEVLGQGVQDTGGGDDDVSLTADSCGVNGTGVADGDGGVLSHQHHGSGLADNQGAADDDSLLAGAVDAVVIQDLHAGGGGAGSEAQALGAFEDAGVGQVGHGVDILLGSQTVADLLLVVLQVLGQRQRVYIIVGYIIILVTNCMFVKVFVFKQDSILLDIIMIILCESSIVYVNLSMNSFIIDKYGKNDLGRKYATYGVTYVVFFALAVVLVVYREYLSTWFCFISVSFSFIGMLIAGIVLYVDKDKAYSREIRPRR